MNWVSLVGKVGFEPTSPQETDLQSAAALQLCRLPILNGDPSGTWTQDSLIKSQVLYHWANESYVVQL